jgi:hypothetical protein
MQKAERRIVVCAAVVATLLLMLLPTSSGGAAPAAAATGPGSPSCTSTCGDINITYPFGIEPVCYHATGFNLTCDRSYQPPKLFLGDGTVQVCSTYFPTAARCASTAAAWNSRTVMRVAP